MTVEDDGGAPDQLSVRPSFVDFADLINGAMTSGFYAKVSWHGQPAVFPCPAIGRIMDHDLTYGIVNSDGRIILAPIPPEMSASELNNRGRT